MSRARSVTDYGKGMAAKIRRLWDCTPLNREEIAEKLGCSRKYVANVIAKPMDYGANWIRRKRKTDKFFREEDRRAKRVYMRKRLKSDPKFRAKQLARSRAWKRRQRESKTK